MKNIEECDGTGELFLSCYGDDINFNLPEFDLCPTCGEHYGDKGEPCDLFTGTGEVIEVHTTRDYVIKKSKSHIDGYIFTNRISKSKFMLVASIEYIKTLK